MEKIEVRKKYVYLEVMRIVAIFFIIFNHTATDGFFLVCEARSGEYTILGIYVYINIL